MHDDLFNALTINGIILTPNQRLSTYLIQAYAAWQGKQAAIAWQTQPIMPLKNWLTHLSIASKAHTEKQLTEQQACVLWQQIIHQDALVHVLNQEQTAKEAHTAWLLLQEWQRSLHDLPNNYSDELNTFMRWVNAFDKQLAKNHWVLPIQLIQRCAQSLKEQTLPLPEKIFLFGFDALSPLYQNIIHQCNKASEVIHINDKIKPEKIQRTEISSQQMELISMANWAKTYHLNNPNKKIACIVPNLTGLYQPLLRVFSRTFAYNSSQHQPSPFNISSGLALSAYPIIQTALQALQLKSSNNDLALDTITPLLCSPYLHTTEQELSEAALLDQQLHRNSPSVISATLLATLLNKKEQQRSLNMRWSNYLTGLYSTQTKPFADWVKDWQMMLSELGWPGYRTLPSDTYQVVARWQTLLVEYASLDSIMPPQSFDRAIQILGQLANQTTFQPKTQGTPAIEILGTLEAAGMHFDALWLMGTDADTWPSSAKPNSFLPKGLQRQWDMPHSSAEREYRFAKQLIDRLLNSAKTVIISSAQQKGDCQLSPSPLICHVPLVDLKTINADIQSGLPNPSNASIYEHYTEHQAPALKNHERILGGSRILQLQSNCPFSAFAEVRLNARGMNQSHSGPNPITRGTLIHACLATLWQKIKNHSELINYKEEQLKTLINQITWQHINELTFFKYISQKRFIDLEQQRLADLLYQWLDYEKKRDDFTVIATEISYTTTIKQLPMTLTLDRVDQLATGERVIIDYKTGQANYRDWLGDRPKEPQLPLYAITYQDKPIGIAYGHIRANEMTLKGIAKHDYSLKGFYDIQKIKEYSSWNELNKNWQQTLHQLAHNFMSGDAKVNPKHIKQSCEYCQLHHLCRIQTL